MQRTHTLIHVLARLLSLVALAALLAPTNLLVYAAESPIVLEAEHAEQNTPRGTYKWELASDVDGFSGHGFMRALPKAYHYFGSDATKTSPELRYPVTLPSNGVYYLWVRSNNSSSDGNSVYLGLDGTIAAGLSTSSDGKWRWSQFTVDGARAQVKASAGSHTLSLWAREAGQQIDRVLLTTDRAYEPTGLGPDVAEDHSGHAGHGATPAPAPTNAAALPTPTTGAVVPTTHPAGCRDGELFVDAQDWWMPGPGQRGNNFGHIHTSLCFPHNQTVTGKLTLTVVSKLHNNPGAFYGLNISSDKTISENRKRCSDSGALNCWRDRKNPRTLARCTQTGGTVADNGMTCIWTDKITIDTKDFDTDGWKQIRVRALVREPDGNDQRTSTGLQIFVKNGRQRKDYSALPHGPNWTEGRGWYGGEVNYSNSGIQEPPTKPVSGIWQPAVSMARGADGIAVTGWYAALDTDFHKGNPGIALCPNGVRGTGDSIQCGPGSFKGKLRIDTTKLTNGWHRLFLKTDARASALDSTNSGVLAIWFQVRN